MNAKGIANGDLELVREPFELQPTAAEQDYLRAICELEYTHGSASTTAIANALEVRPPSVTGMLRRLANAGWTNYEPGRGAKLTSKGKAFALQAIRRHRLLELFLVRVLAIDSDEVDAEADAIEHAISTRLMHVIADYLGNPMYDPHGHPIPQSN